MAREQLLAVFQREFERASAARDATATSRFFKLFPAIGWEEEGLQAYALFVVELVKVRAPASAKSTLFICASCSPQLMYIASSPLYYITALTALFESIALIVDQHQPVVEKYYGRGKMDLVLDRLLQEADRVVKDLLEGWKEERSIQRKVCRCALHEGFSSLRVRLVIRYLPFDAFKHSEATVVRQPRGGGGHIGPS